MIIFQTLRRSTKHNANYFTLNIKPIKHANSKNKKKEEKRILNCITDQTAKARHHHHQRVWHSRL